MLGMVYILIMLIYLITVFVKWQLINNEAVYPDVFYPRVYPTGKMLSGEEDGLEDDPERAEVTASAFTGENGRHKTEIKCKKGKQMCFFFVFLLASVVGADGSSAAQVDIITEQPRSSQHTLQPGDSVDLSASSDQGGGGGTSTSDTPESPNDNEEEMLSRSSSGGANITPETTEYTTPENATPEGGPLGQSGSLIDSNDPSLPPSDSSQTTTEGPDSAVTPSDVAELVSLSTYKLLEIYLCFMSWSNSHCPVITEF